MPTSRTSSTTTPSIMSPGRTEDGTRICLDHRGVHDTGASPPVDRGGSGPAPARSVARCHCHRPPGRACLAWGKAEYVAPVAADDTVARDPHRRGARSSASPCGWRTKLGSSMRPTVAAIKPSGHPLVVAASSSKARRRLCGRNSTKFSTSRRTSCGKARRHCGRVSVRPRPIDLAACATGLPADPRATAG